MSGWVHAIVVTPAFCGGVMTYSLDVRAQVFALLGQGVPWRAAAAQVGVSGSTLGRWWAEVGGVLGDPPVDGGRYLSRAERYEIARLAEAGVGVRETARRLGRSAATVSRELARPARALGSPGRPAGRGERGGGRSYQPEAAHQAALAARARPKPSKLSRTPVLKAWVQDRLDQRDSPEQVAGRLRVEFPGQQEMHISHETIYRAIYVLPRGELRRQLRAHLRTGRTLRRPRNTRQHRETRGQIVAAVSIRERPVEIEERLVPGHYEGDLVVGPPGSSAAIATLVERTSGHLTTVLLPTKTTLATIDGLKDALTRTGWPMKTLTWDRGKEMAAHARFTIDTGVAVYFADPHAPWQRGSSENTNGLLREYFPKGLDLAQINNNDLQAATAQLNDRPRKRHGFLTPNEVLTGILTTDQTKPAVATTP